MKTVVSYLNKHVFTHLTAVIPDDWYILKPLMIILNIKMLLLVFKINIFIIIAILLF